MLVSVRVFVVNLIFASRLGSSMKFVMVFRFGGVCVGNSGVG